jgi:hypothetical protein
LSALFNSHTEKKPSPATIMPHTIPLQPSMARLVTSYDGRCVWVLAFLGALGTRDLLVKILSVKEFFRILDSDPDIGLVVPA